MNNLNYCNFAKTVLMLFVVLCHSAAFYAGNWFTVCPASETNRVLGTLATWLGTFHVQGFTLISGYIYFYIKNEKKCYLDFRMYISNKFKRLLIPYISISLFWVIPFGSLFYSYGSIDILNNYVLGESPSQLWFLLMLFNVFVIYDIIVARLRGAYQILFIVLLFVGGISLGKLIPNVFQILTSMRFILFFYIGCLIRKKYSDLQPDRMLRYGIIFLLLNISFFTLLNLNVSDNSIVAKGISLIAKNICDVCGAIMSFLLLSYIASKCRWETSFFRTLSIVSFPIYLFHQQIIYILLWNFQSSLNPYLMCAINLLGSLLVSYSISMVLMKQSVTKKIIGIK